MLVSMETGISDIARVLARVSITTRNSPPQAILHGIRRVLSLPTSILAICGINSPTQLITPHMAVIEAVISVEATMINPRNSGRFTPREIASSLERDNTFIRYRQR